MLFNQAIGFDRTNAMALMGLSDIYFDTGDDQKAVLYAERGGRTPRPRTRPIASSSATRTTRCCATRTRSSSTKRAKKLGSTQADDRIAKVQARLGG